LYAAETWTISKTDIKRIEAFEMWLWRSMEKISWTAKVSNSEVLRRVMEDRCIVKYDENVNGLIMFSAMMCYRETYWKAECWANVPEEEGDYS